LQAFYSAKYAALLKTNCFVLASKKVLIITYYWPPGGGAGVQRWLKFVKYLPQNGWDPIVYTPSNGEMPVLDSTLEKDIPKGITVLKQPIWEPYSWYKRFVGASKTEKINTGFLTENRRPGFTQRISVWLRGNLFIPDARCFWINPSVGFLSKWLRQNHVDVIVSSGPPHSMHLIAAKLSSICHIPWVADFRDPWTNIDYYKDLKLTSWADKKHHRLERFVLTNANKVVVVGNGMKEEFKSNHDVDSVVITNGFDPDDFIGVEPKINDKFLISHVGTLVPSRNPLALWKVLGELIQKDMDFAGLLKIRLVGKVDVSVKDSIESCGLSNHVEYVDYMSHESVPSELCSASLLLLVLNDTPNAKGILTGKLFEYLAAGVPILCVGPEDGDASAVLKDANAGKAIAFDNMIGMKSFLTNAFANFRNTSVKSLDQKSNADKYSRASLTKSLVSVLDAVSKTKK
jgi:glycosyltransferase involved in cell wall biosynthesis